MAAKKNKSVSWLSDDKLAIILNSVTDSDDRKSFSEVCKQWCRVEGLNRTTIRLLQLDHLRRVLPRFPNLVTFKTSKHITRNDIEFIDQTCPKIETIDLSRDDVTAEPRVSEDLYALAHCFPKLKHLGLGNCCVSDETLVAIGSLSCLSYLNLEGCDMITEGLGFLADGPCSKTLKTLIGGLVLSGCGGITGSGADHLHDMSCLEEVHVGGMNKLSKDGYLVVTRIPTLKKLNLGTMEDFQLHTSILSKGNKTCHTFCVDNRCATIPLYM